MTIPQKLSIDLTAFAAGQRVCCAVSGGADSTALLLGLHDANQAKHPLSVVLSAIHVHHGLRGVEADEDEQFVRELCARIGVPLTVIQVDTAARRAQEREGIEEAARELRYAAFDELLAGGQADVIATAHTLDDQAETVMMKLLRGAWTEGLGGISPQVIRPLSGDPLTGKTSFQLPVGRASSGPAIIRPLLGVRRGEIETFLRARAQGWREDSSNKDITLTRNRVRHELMPMLRSFNPQIDQTLANLANIARDEEEHWAGEMQKLLPQVVLPGKPVRGGGRAVSTTVGEKSLSIELERLRTLDAAVRRRLLRAAARSLGTRLSAAETVKVLALAGFGGHSGIKGSIGSRLELRAGFRVERSARELRLWCRGVEQA